ncbi:MAG: biotin/lipoyl-containing protein [Pseudomonadota bacterium]
MNDAEKELVTFLADTMDSYGLGEIAYRNDQVKILLKKESSTSPAPVIAAAPMPAAAAATTAVPLETPQASANTINSPIVGIVYLSSEPGAEPYVKPGQSVQVGQTVAIVEAMKVMNPVTATKSGTIKDILVANAQPIEFDQPIFSLV